MNYETVLKSDIKIKALLTGRFSSHERALPVKPMETHARDQITFQIINLRDINKPHWFLILLSMARVDLLGLSLSPLILGSLYFFTFGYQMEPVLMGCAVTAIVFLHSSVFMFNDYMDHVLGGDAFSLTAGSQVIQKGWIQAYRMLNLSVLFFAIGFGFAIPLILLKPIVLIPMSLFVAVAMMGFSFLGKGFKSLGVGEFFIFLCFGPLLMFGVHVLMEAPLSKTALFMGVVLGCMSVFYQQFKNFLSLYSDHQQKVGTFISRLGFDRAKIFLTIELFFVMTLAFGLFLGLFPLWYSAFSILFVSLYGFRIFKMLKKIDSPMSGELMKLPRMALKLHGLTSILLALYYVVYAWGSRG